MPQIVGIDHLQLLLLVAADVLLGVEAEMRQTGVRKKKYSESSPAPPVL